MNIYWFPLEESIGNCPSWSEYDLEVLGLVLIIAARMLLQCLSCLGWMSLRSSWYDWVERRFLFLIKVTLHGEGGLGKMFRDEARRQAGT